MEIALYIVDIREELPEEENIAQEIAPFYKESVYAFGLAVVGEASEIPSGVRIGKNTAIVGKTTPEDYPNGELPSGAVIIKAGDRV